jgi:L-galactose dehydrogenase
MLNMIPCPVVKIGILTGKMQYRILGKTGLHVSVMGLGCGGHSRLGLATGKTETQAVALVQQALSLGINFLDTAESYGTEGVVGQAIKNTPSESVILSTKLSPHYQDRMTTGAELMERFNGTLSRLQTDHVDILHLHGVTADEYAYCVTELVPALETLRAEGKVRFIGITEAFIPDPQHAMTVQAIKDDCWDVMMVGFNFLNQSARERVFAATQAKNIGVLGMFAVRRAISRPEVLREVLGELASLGLLERDAIDLDTLAPLLPSGTSESDLTDIAYRFCNNEPGMHVVLSGTGNPEHLASNAQSLIAPPLSASHTKMLHQIFRRVDSISGN